MNSSEELRRAERETDEMWDFLYLDADDVPPNRPSALAEAAE